MANCHRATTASDDCCWSRDRKIRRRRFAHEGPYKLLPLSLLNALSLMTVSSFHPSQLRCEVYFRRLIHTNCEGVSNGKQWKVDFIVDLKLQLRYSKISMSRACLTTDVASVSLSCPFRHSKQKNCFCCCWCCCCSENASKVAIFNALTRVCQCSPKHDLI